VWSQGGELWTDAGRLTATPGVPEAQAAPSPVTAPAPVPAADRDLLPRALERRPGPSDLDRDSDDDGLGDGVERRASPPCFVEPCPLAPVRAAAQRPPRRGR